MLPGLAARRELARLYSGVVATCSATLVIVRFLCALAARRPWGLSGGHPWLLGGSEDP